ncbi:MAG: TlpA family protein disulfide reductase [Janthinobacterium lividum]
MKTFFTVGLALLTGPALAQSPSCQLVGNIIGLGTRPIEYRYTRQEHTHTDTIQVVNDHFARSIVGGDGNLGTLWFQASLTGGFDTLPVWVEPGKVSVSGSADKLNYLSATGTPENDVLAACKRAVLAAPRQEGKTTRDFVRAHPAARASAYLLLEQTGNNPAVSAATYRQLLQGFAPAVQQSWFGQQANVRIQILENQPSVGKPAPAFVLPDTAGTMVSLATYRGHYVLLDFWGHWCHPCLEAMPELHLLYQHYQPKLTLIGVARERDTVKWKEAIRQHHVPGLQVSELQSGEGPVMTRYNVGAYPTYMLLDQQGTLLLSTSSLGEVQKMLTTLTGL